MRKSSTFLFCAASLFLTNAVYGAENDKSNQTQDDQAKSKMKAAPPKPAAAPGATRSYRSINPPTPDMGSSDGGRTDDPIGGLPGNSAPSGMDKRP